MENLNKNGGNSANKKFKNPKNREGVKFNLMPQIKKKNPILNNTIKTGMEMIYTFAIKMLRVLYSTVELPIICSIFF